MNIIEKIKTLFKAPSVPIINQAVKLKNKSVIINFRIDSKTQSMINHKIGKQKISNYLRELIERDFADAK